MHSVFSMLLECSWKAFSLLFGRFVNACWNASSVFLACFSNVWECSFNVVGMVVICFLDVFQCFWNDVFDDSGKADVKHLRSIEQTLKLA